MKTTTIPKILILLVLFASFPVRQSTADLSKAKEMSYRIAEKIRGRGFTLLPGESGDNSSDVQSFEFPVTKGVDYAFIVASDNEIITNLNAGDEFLANQLDIDLYVEDENGTGIVEDTRNAPDAFVQYTSQYNGKAKLKLVFAVESKNVGKVYKRFFLLIGVRGGDPTPP